MASKINQIFISYAWDPATRNDVWQFCEYLLASNCFDESGIRRREDENIPNILWLDKLEMHGKTDETMTRSINNSELVVVFLSDFYQTRRNCQYEFIQTYNHCSPRNTQKKVIFVNLETKKTMVTWNAPAHSELNDVEGLRKARLWFANSRFLQHPFYSITSISQRFHLLEKEIKGICPQLHFRALSYDPKYEPGVLVPLKVFFTENISCFKRDLSECEIFIDHQCYGQVHSEDLQLLRLFLRKNLYEAGDVLFETDRDRNEEQRKNFHKFKKIKVFVALVTAEYDIDLIRRANERRLQIILVRYEHNNLEEIDGRITNWDGDNAPADGYDRQHVNLQSARLVDEQFSTKKVSGYWIRLKQMIISALKAGKRDTVKYKIYADDTSAHIMAQNDTNKVTDLRMNVNNLPESEAIREKLRSIETYMVIYGERGVGKSSLIGMTLKSTSSFNDILRSFEFVFWLNYPGDGHFDLSGNDVSLNEKNFINEWLYGAFQKHVEHLSDDLKSGKILTDLIAKRALVILDNVPQQQLMAIRELLVSASKGKLAFALVCDGLVDPGDHPLVYMVTPRKNNEIQLMKKMQAVESSNELKDMLEHLASASYGLPLAAQVMLADIDAAISPQAKRALAESYIEAIRSTDSADTDEGRRSEAQKKLDKRFKEMFARFEKERFRLLPHYRKLFIFNHNQNFSLQDVQLLWGSANLAYAHIDANTLEQRCVLRMVPNSDDISIHMFLSRAFLLYEQERMGTSCESETHSQLRHEVLRSITQSRPNFVDDSKEREKLIDALFNVDKQISAFDDIKEKDVVRMLLRDFEKYDDSNRLAKDLQYLSAYFPNRSSMVNFFAYLLEKRPQQLRKILWKMFSTHNAKLTMEYFFSMPESDNSLKIQKCLDCCELSLQPDMGENDPRRELQRIGKLLVEFGGLAALNELKARKRLVSQRNIRRIIKTVPPGESGPEIFVSGEVIEALAASGCYPILIANKDDIAQKLASGFLDKERFLREIISSNQLKLYEIVQDLSESGNTYAHAVLCIKNGLLQILHLIRTKYDPDILAKKDETGRTLAFEAALAGHTHILEYILTYYRETCHDFELNLRHQDDNGRTLLFEAAMGNKWNVVKFLIDANCINVLEPWLTDKHGRNLTFEAASFGSFDFVDQLKNTALDRSDDLRTVVDNDGQTPAFIAVKNGNCAVLQELFNKGVDLSKEDIKGCNIAFQLPQTSNGVNEITTFLRSKNVNVNSFSKEGFTPIMEACKHSNLEALKALKASGATIRAYVDSNNHFFDGKCTLLSLAVANNDRKLFAFILENCSEDIEALIDLDPATLVRAIRLREDYYVSELLKRGADRPAIFAQISFSVCKALLSICYESENIDSFTFPEKIIDAFEQFACHSLTEYFATTELLRNAIEFYDPGQLRNLIFLGARPVSQNILEHISKSSNPLAALKQVLKWPMDILLSESRQLHTLPDAAVDQFSDCDIKTELIRFLMARNVKEKEVIFRPLRDGQNVELIHCDVLITGEESKTIFVSRYDTGAEVMVRILRKCHIAEQDFWRYDVTLFETESIVEELNVYEFLRRARGRSKDSVKLRLEKRKFIQVACYERHAERMQHYTLSLADLLNAADRVREALYQISEGRNLPIQNLALFSHPFDESTEVTNDFLMEVLGPRCYLVLEIKVPLNLYRRTRFGDKQIGQCLLKLDDPIPRISNSLDVMNLEIIDDMDVKFVKNDSLPLTLDLWSLMGLPETIVRQIQLQTGTTRNDFRLTFKYNNPPLIQQLLSQHPSVAKDEVLEAAFNGLHASAIVKLDVFKTWREELLEALDNQTVKDALKDDRLKKTIFVKDPQQGKCCCQFEDPLWKWIEKVDQKMIEFIKE